MTKRRFSRKEETGITYLLQAVRKLAPSDEDVLESAVLEDALAFLSGLETVKAANESMAHLEREKDVVFVNNSCLSGKDYLLVMQYNDPSSVPYTILPPKIGIKSIPQEFLRRLKFMGVSKLLSKEQGYPPLIVEKRRDSHRGKGLQVFTPRQFLRNAKNDGSHIYQTFCYPWERLSPDGHMRDCRVVLIDGEPAGYYLRRARDPLIDTSTGKLIEYPPSLTRVLTNIAQGGEVETDIDTDLRDRLYENSRIMHKFIVGYTRLQNRLVGVRQEDVRYGLLAVDFLFYSTGQEAVAEVDWVPDLSAYPRKDELAETYMRHMAELSDGRRRIFLRNGPLIAEKRAAADRLGIRYGVI